jgi:hypothetical protein
MGGRLWEAKVAKIGQFLLYTRLDPALENMHLATQGKFSEDFNFL